MRNLGAKYEKKRSQKPDRPAIRSQNLSRLTAKKFPFCFLTKNGLSLCE
ncbi:MAG: hypothetical protein ACI9XO_002911, partial [Paraglaciecola sp.]